MSILLNPQHIHIELSSKCTLKCPRCPRTELHPDSLNKEISLDEFRQAFDLTLLSSIQKITFCGDIGDPIYAKDFLEIVKYTKQANVNLVIVTNGSYKSTAWWQELGSVLTANDTVYFSVDGWDQSSNEQYRANSNFESIVNGASALRASTSAQMLWSAIYFKFNEDKMNQIQALAKSLGFDTFHTVSSSKFDNQYLVNGVDPLKPLHYYSKNAQYRVETTSLNEKIIPIVKFQTRSKHAWARCVNWQKEMFINVDGYVFPCPWFNSGYLENSFFDKHKHTLNIKTRTLTEVLNDPLWEELYSLFDNNPLDICKMKCKNAR